MQRQNDQFWDTLGYKARACLGKVRKLMTCIHRWLIQIKGPDHWRNKTRNFHQLTPPLPFLWWIARRFRQTMKLFELELLNLYISYIWFITEQTYSWIHFAWNGYSCFTARELDSFPPSWMPGTWMDTFISPCILAPTIPGGRHQC